MRILVTGANGFLGQRFQSYAKDKYDLVPVSLRATKPEELDLKGIDVILHLAVVAHDASKVNDPVQFAVNVDMTRSLAEAAIKAGVPHFIFMSTAKVYGEGSKDPLNEHSTCDPADAYGKSKLIAENLLLNLNDPQFTVAIIRTPLVYGPNVKGNMLRILQLAEKSWPLPFKNSGNQRSMVFVDNLMALVDTIIKERSSGIFIAGDEHPLSTGELVSLIRKQMHKEDRMFVVPSFIKSALKLVKPSLFNRLYGSFVLDPAYTNQRLNFKPPFSTKEGVAAMVNWFTIHNNTTSAK